jgi:hypothetical protein
MTDTEDLQKKLIKLQQQNLIAYVAVQQTRQMLYKQLAAIYLWWREAKMVDGYLEKQYSTVINRKTRELKSSINFNPLVLLTFGKATLRSTDSNKYSRALNKVHAEFESRPAHYEKNGVNKLANFMQNSGGISELADNISKKDKVAKPDKSFSTPSKPNAITTADLAEAAKEFFTNQPALLPVALTNYIEADSENYSVLLVRNTETGYECVATAYDQSIIQTILASSYKRRFDALPQSIRPLFELLQTQCLPQHLQSISKALVDKTRLEEMGKTLYLSARRAMYRYDTGELILSPITAYSGVVSVVKTAKPILFDVQTDVFLPMYLRGVIERHCLRGYDFNLYAVSNNDQIPQYPTQNSASHVIRLQKQNDIADFLDLHFWPFYNTLPKRQDQVVVQSDYQFKAKWELALGGDWFKYLNDKFLSLWLNSHAKYLKRKQQELLKVTFAANEITFAFYNVDDQFEHNLAVSLLNSQPVHSDFTTYFLSKDLAPVLRSLLDFTIVGLVDLAVNDDVLQLKWATGAGEFAVYVPTANSDGKRSTAAFRRYKPAETLDDSVYDNEPDAQEELAENWGEAYFGGLA